jgi:hypothetical protein
MFEVIPHSRTRGNASVRLPAVALVRATAEESLRIDHEQ